MKRRNKMSIQNKLLNEVTIKGEQMKGGNSKMIEKITLEITAEDLLEIILCLSIESKRYFDISLAKSEEDRDFWTKAYLKTNAVLEQIRKSYPTLSF